MKNIASSLRTILSLQAQLNTAISGLQQQFGVSSAAPRTAASARSRGGFRRTGVARRKQASRKKSSAQST